MLSRKPIWWWDEPSAALEKKVRSLQLLCFPSFLPSFSSSTGITLVWARVAHSSPLAISAAISAEVFRLSKSGSRLKAGEDSLWTLGVRSSVTCPNQSEGQLTQSIHGIPLSLRRNSYKRALITRIEAPSLDSPILNPFRVCEIRWSSFGVDARLIRAAKGLWQKVSCEMLRRVG